MEKWKPASFLVATAFGPDAVEGRTYRGLGLRMMIKGSPKGRRPPTFGVWHLGTGHKVRTITAPWELAIHIATEIAEVSDWEAFDSLHGWENTDPELREKLWAIDARYPSALIRGGAGHNESVAVAIASARAS